MSQDILYARAMDRWFQTPSSTMTNGGMTAVDLKREDLEALAAYLRQLR